MTLDDLIKRLEQARDAFGGETEVRLQIQQSWPFECEIHGLCSTDDIWQPDEEDDQPLGEGHYVYIVEGGQLGYGSKNAWDAAR